MLHRSKCSPRSSHSEPSASSRPSLFSYLFDDPPVSPPASEAKSPDTTSDDPSPPPTSALTPASESQAKDDATSLESAEKPPPESEPNVVRVTLPLNERASADGGPRKKRKHRTVSFVSREDDDEPTSSSGSAYAAAEEANTNTLERLLTFSDYQASLFESISNERLETFLRTHLLENKSESSREQARKFIYMLWKSVLECDRSKRERFESMRVVAERSGVTMTGRPFVRAKTAPAKMHLGEVKEEKDEKVLFDRAD